MKVLSVLDDKIASNRRLTDVLRGTARGLFDRALLQGESVDATVDDIVQFQNRRRRPLSAAERLTMPGDIPYYGATGAFDRVRDHLFDEVLLLVGEDGSVVRGDGTPVTQYVWGPCWVNNHAHVLTGHGASTELALLAIERADVTSWVTGAVQRLVSGRIRVPLSDDVEEQIGAATEALA